MRAVDPCIREKVKYFKKKDAKKRARSQERRSGVKLSVYKCGNHYHLAKEKKRRKKSRKKPKKRMKRNIIHFMYVPFTGLGLHGGYRGDKWLENRITIFKRFVLSSLRNQSKQEFITWISWRPEDKGNPLVQAFKRHLDQMRGMRFVFTYHGLCFYDDKYEHDTAMKRLEKSLRLSINDLKDYIPDDTERIYMTIQPSDDMYTSDAVEKIQNYRPEDAGREIKAVGWKRGYVMNYATKEVAKYNPTTNPPFTTHIFFDRLTFMDSWLHMRHTGPYHSHEEVRFDDIGGRGYCVGTHGENISTTWNIPYKGEEILGEARNIIWREFGVFHSDPVIVHRRVRLVGRIIINRLPLPLQSIIKVIYHRIRDIYYAIRNNRR